MYTRREAVEKCSDSERQKEKGSKEEGKRILPDPCVLSILFMPSNFLLVPSFLVSSFCASVTLPGDPERCPIFQCAASQISYRFLLSFERILFFHILFRQREKRTMNEASGQHTVSSLPASLASKASSAAIGDTTHWEMRLTMGQENKISLCRKKEGD